MKIKYDWKVDNMKIAPTLDELTNVVTQVSYSYIATDEDSGESISYPLTFNPDAPNKEFKKYEKLSEEDVINWVKTTYDLTAINSYLTKQIEEKIGTKYTPAELPWAKNITPDITNKK